MCRYNRHLIARTQRSFLSVCAEVYYFTLNEIFSFVFSKSGGWIKLQSDRGENC